MKQRHNPAMHIPKPNLALPDYPSRSLRDLAAVVLFTAAAFWIAAWLELNERINRWTASGEFWQADELRTTLLALALALGWFSWRRWRELKAELTLRTQLQGELARALAANRQLTRRSLELQETERKHIAHELHDELGQYLNAIEIEAVSLRSELASAPAIQVESVERIRVLARHVYDVARTLMRRLRPVGLDELGLEAALQQLLERWRVRRTEVHCALQVDPRIPTLHEDLNVAIFRMVQEALNNIARHAQATQVHVQLTASDAEWLRLVVSDNGVGMAAKAPAGLGLTGIRERAELLGGSCTIESGNGVRLTLRLPLSPVPLPEDPDDD